MNEQIWVKYNLLKDGTPVWDGLPTLAAAKAHIEHLRGKGYNPVIDHKLGKQEETHK